MNLISDELKALDVTVTDLAAVLNVSKQTTHSYLSGKYKPSSEFWVAIRAIGGRGARSKL